jgi:hypothetical protein|tara:strand:+ start:1585 stop:1866 length:282 start_codon:yes stop_codon:yes gene_type:complete
MALGRTAQYYKDNPEARKKKNAYQKKYNKRPSEIKRRSELVKLNRKMGTYGNGDKKDVSHKSNGKVTLRPQSKNRGDTNDTKGDKKARGKKKK